MIKEILLQQKQRKNLIIISFLFLIFLTIYTLVDSLNMSYASMKQEFGIVLPILNIGLNIIMSFISALMIGVSTTFAKATGKREHGSDFSFISIVFGMMTYGCTPCLISFFASFGIPFAVTALPFANLPYKLISLLLIAIGFIWILYTVSHPKCKVSKTAKE